MKYLRILMPLMLIVFFVAGCSKQSDEETIQALLESSWFVADGAVQTADDSTNVPQAPNGAQILADTLGWVRWVRWIERPVTREFDIVVNGDSADVTVTAYFQGNPPGYGFFVVNDPLNPVYQRAISDSVIRKVKLYRGDDDKWHIASLTVADIYTVNTNNPVTITEIRAQVASRNYEFVVNSADTYFEKDELPIFYPSDTVEVTVTCSAQNDSTWAFLHHGTGHRPGIGHHIRQPFYRENTTTFTRTWIIADDSVVTTPAVRHSAVDVLGWETLFGDSTATYYSRAWCLPYIIMEPGEELPQDED
ncbi:MAG TPA: hypothetical protein ENI34_00110 [candidate division WOR-3 bacterium]|uniref:Uncharacterized protein n=1 Tax=candidate division WOR-3 bacterium TaxID=2052148 RepID=A0A9C9EK67_UNCW3|nr:hypothetical protein [candidate division WOR-3 bacterium]